MNNKNLQWILLLSLSFVWGSSFILMKEGLKAYSSDEVAGLRITIASLFLLPFLIKYHSINLKKYYKGLLFSGVFGNLLPAFLFTKAETQISSSLTGMLNALTPVFTVIVGYMFFKQKISKFHTLGVLLGFIGAIGVVYFGVGSESSKNVLYCLFVLLATLFYALSVNGINTFLKGLNPITATVWSFTMIGPIAAIYLFGFTDVVKHTQLNPEAGKSLLFISVLAIFGSALSVVAFNKLIQISGVVFASSCTYLIPIFAILWGLIYKEEVQFAQILMVGIVILGVWVINLGKKESLN